MKNLPFTEKQRSIIVGSVLGNACLHVNWSKTNYTLKITRSAKQKEYLEWQYQQLQPFVRTAPRLYEPTRSYTIRTISHSELTELHGEFYPQGKKILPSRIAEYMKNQLTMAVWFMDDGNAGNHKGKLLAYYLNTQSFSRDDNEVIKRSFLQVHGIHSSVLLNHGYFRIAIHRQESREKFRNLIKEFVVPTMQYKLGYVSDSLRTRRD